MNDPEPRPTPLLWFGRELPEYQPGGHGLYHVTDGVVLLVREIPGVPFSHEASLYVEGDPILHTVGNATRREAVADLATKATRMAEVWGRVCAHAT